MTYDLGDCHCGVPIPAASVLPGNWLEMRILTILLLPGLLNQKLSLPVGVLTTLQGDSDECHILEPLVYEFSLGSWDSPRQSLCRYSCVVNRTEKPQACPLCLCVMGPSTRSGGHGSREQVPSSRELTLHRWVSCSWPDEGTRIGPDLPGARKDLRDLQPEAVCIFGRWLSPQGQAAGMGLTFLC